MERRTFAPSGLVAALLLAPQLAQAHLVSTPFGDFYGGMLHPITALEHLLPWLALGLLGGIQMKERSRWLLLVFPASVLLGVCLGVALGAPTWLTLVNLTSLVLIAAPTIAGLRLPTAALAGLGGLFGATHGAANGGALTPEGNALLFVSGVTAASYLLIALVVALAYTLVHRFQWGQIAVRALSSWIAAIGVLMLGLQFAPAA